MAIVEFKCMAPKKKKEKKKEKKKDNATTLKNFIKTGYKIDVRLF